MRARKRKLHPLDYAIFCVVVGVIGYVAYRVESVLVYTWDWGAIPTYLFRRDEQSGELVPNLLILGLITTLRIACWGMLLASILGVALGVARTSKRLLPRLVGWAYVGFIRNIPPVPFLFLFYFFVSNQILPTVGIEEWLDSLSPAGIRVIEMPYER